ncbi:MAG: PSD1 and planctomycete cytochrome C domain-containing protein [Prosthecobacter sp.]|uniref:PSD1 and planctomycete cytochrome C domain-containing protein n=1 Tax=Prosthecobacter sp. TaxID=1965333 RepID=UPI0038FFAC57
MRLIFLLAATSAGAITPEHSAFFEAKIRPVLAEKCYSCHSAQAEKLKGELLLDTRAGTLKGGENGPAIVPGDVNKSLLITALRWHDADTGMPPQNKGGKLPDSVIADFEQWVKLGAPDPREGAASVVKAYDPVSAKSWWAYQPLTKPAVPQPKDAGWAKTDIDRFILAKLEEKKLKPVADANAATLTRRLYLDLTGLPPPAEQSAQFSVLSSQIQNLSTKHSALSTDSSVDSLLATRQFAERWARHWLDVARFAETTGRDVNMTMPEAWRYRDYVIEAFQADKPFDQFIREQIAGDLLPDRGDADRAKLLIATGFLAVGPKALNGTDPRQFAVDLADEQIDAVSQAFMGMTIACARCHDHKFDPISQRDYTALAGIFLSTDTRFGTPGGVQGRNAASLIEVPVSAGLKTLDRRMDPALWARKKVEYDGLVARRDAALASRAPGASQTGGAQMTGFDIVRTITRAKQVEMDIIAFNPDGSLKPRVMGVLDKPAIAPAARRGRMNSSTGGPNSRGRRGSGFEAIADSPLFVRGSIDKESDAVPRGLPEFIAHGAKLEIAQGTSGRLELANWIASPQNTLTARVTVNRVWHWLFGRGLVESVDNFGASGALPSHPELLDYLAQQFIADGWSLKKLIKRIVTSRVYQLDTRYDEANNTADPDNTLLWRMNTRRLDAETIRDAMLAASGALDLTPQAGSIVAKAGDGPIGGERFQILNEEMISQANGRFRSLYLPVARNVQPETLAVFDFTDPSVVLGARETTIVPPQALYLMNSDFVSTQAAIMAKRVMAENGFEERFNLACRLAYGREPLADELQAAKKLDHNDLASWTSICRALFASADFLFIN